MKETGHRKESLTISRRLDFLSDLVHYFGPIEALADVGTDHGYVPWRLLSDGFQGRCVLCDVNAGPLNNARETFSKYPRELERVAFRQGDGLEPLVGGEAEVVVIAGMGGGLIRAILSEDIEKSKRFSHFLLQPMTEQEMLRNWLLANGFTYEWDAFFTERGKHYEYIAVSSRVTGEATEVSGWKTGTMDMEFGRFVLEGSYDAYRDFLISKIKKYTRIFKAVEGGETVRMRQRRDVAAYKLDTAETLLNTFERERHAL